MEEQKIFVLALQKISYKYILLYNRIIIKIIIKAYIASINVLVFKKIHAGES